MFCAKKCVFSAHAYLKLGVNGTHSDQKLVRQNKMQVKILPALSDNYMYLVSFLSISLRAYKFKIFEF